MTQGEDMEMVESSNMKDSSSEKLIRTFLQRKLIIMESSKSKIQPHIFVFGRE